MHLGIPRLFRKPLTQNQQVDIGHRSSGFVSSNGETPPKRKHTHTTNKRKRKNKNSGHLVSLAHRQIGEPLKTGLSSDPPLKV